MSDNFQRLREPEGIWGVFVKVLLMTAPILGCLYIFQVHVYLGVSLYPQQYFGLLLGIILSLNFLMRPRIKGGLGKGIPWYDAVFSITSLFIGFYLAILYPEVAGYNVAYIEWHKVILGAISIILLLEATRRSVGWPLTILAILFILYGHYTEFLPGPLSTGGMSWRRLATSLFLEPGAMLGVPLKISLTMLLGFLFFASFLTVGGAMKFMSDISFALMGKYRGGPAKVAVTASALFGSLSGSAVANAVTTGVVTIPMMKKAGYTPEFAAAVEASASTGGVLLPPVMGAVAFLVAEFLGVSYVEVIISAAVPAILYYLCIFTQVHLEAVKTGLSGLPTTQLPSLRKTLAQSWLTVTAFIVLLLSLFHLGVSPERAALYATGATFVVSMFSKETRITLQKFISALIFTTRGMLDIVVIAATAGLIIGVVLLTGVGHLFASELLRLSGGNAVTLLIMTALVSIIMGMGMPGIISYILLAVLVVPALVQLGLNPMASHLFIMYYAALSLITPPVCIATYVTASIAGASPNKAGIRGAALATVAYLVPFVFIFNEGLLLSGSLINILLSTVNAVIACLILAVAVEGFLFRRLNIFARILMSISAILLLMPIWGLISKIIAISIAILILLYELRARRYADNSKLMS